MTTALSLRSVSKRFGSDLVLEDLSLEVSQHELLAVLGSSGSGKTTLLRLISGFEAPDSGSIWIAGSQVAGEVKFVPAEQRKVGFVPQDAALFPHLTVAENIEFGLRSMTKTEREQRVSDLLGLVDLVGFELRKPHELSGGQRHRVALARALAPNPDLILLDEPFSALDAELRTRLREDVRQVLKTTKTTAILVTHDQEEALSMADRVAVLRDGQFAQIGDPREIYQEPNDIELATFVGDSVLLDGVVTDGKIVTALGSLTPLNTVQEGAKGRVAIRPENFYLQPNINGDGVVVGRQYFGHDALVEVKLPNVTIRARANGPFAPEIGMHVTVWVRGSVNFYRN